MSNHPIQNRLNESFDTYKDCIAIEYGDLSISYSQLVKKSAFIADYIITKGIKKDSFIGILLEDKVELIAVILGILKAGCVFVPLDPAYPVERLKIMLSLTDTKFLFCDKSISPGDVALLKPGDKEERIKTTTIDDSFYTGEIEVKPALYTNKHTNRGRREYRLNDPVYIYFTSGTTGKPKGIIGQNKGLLHFINWEIQRFGITHRFRISQLTSQCHDPYLRDIFVPLCSGGTICIPPTRETPLENHRLVNWLEVSAVDIIHCTPGMFSIITSHPLTAESFPALKYIMLAGERVIPAGLSNWYTIFGDRVQLVNFYGPTETTMTKIYYLLSPRDTERNNIPIGKPIAGAKAIILDKYLRLCGQGEVGEIYIRTPYRTYGYCNQQELTASHFIKNPFKQVPGEEIYKSGDLGRMLPDGNIEFIGRADGQVKIRGFRVELSEIENELLRNETVSQCVVAFREDQKKGYPDAYLTSYVVSKNNIKISGSQLRAYLEERLPGYMIPSYFINLEKIPLTANGKIDYNALTAPRKQPTTNEIAPRNRIEQKLLEIWCDQLGIDRVGINESFLLVGGNSLNIMSLISKIHKEFNVRISLGGIFKNSTIEKQALVIKEAVKEKFIPVAPSEDKEYYELSPMQQRLYVIRQVNPGSTAYNISEMLVLEGEASAEKLADTFRQLVKRHESLRTAFDIQGDEPVQRIYKDVEFEIEYNDLKNPKSEIRNPKQIQNSNVQNPKQKPVSSHHSFIRPFDLSHAPLMRVKLIKIRDKEHILMVDMHHIISDARSHQVLVRDFMSIYEGKDLPPLRFQYKDFSQWQHKQNQSQEIKKQETYWLNVFQGKIPKLNLPADFEVTSVPGSEGDDVFFTMENQLYANLKKLIKETGITLYMALLAGYSILLAKYTRQEDIVVGTPISGRNHAHLENIIGVFVNMLPMRNKPASHKTVRQFLEEVKENTLKAFENGDFQFDELVSRLGLERDSGGNPLSDAVFNMFTVNNNQNSGDSSGLKVSPYQFVRRTTPFHLLLMAWEDNDTVTMQLTFSTVLFKKVTIEKMAAHYMDIMKEVVRDSRIRIADIKISHELLTIKPAAPREQQPAFNF